MTIKDAEGKIVKRVKLEGNQIELTNNPDDGLKAVVKDPKGNAVQGISRKEPGAQVISITKPPESRPKPSNN